MYYLHMQCMLIVLSILMNIVACFRHGLVVKDNAGQAIIELNCLWKERRCYGWLYWYVYDEQQHLMVVFC